MTTEQEIAKDLQEALKAVYSALQKSKKLDSLHDTEKDALYDTMIEVRNQIANFAHL